jgi:hypothetical protein
MPTIEQEPAIKEETPKIKEETPESIDMKSIKKKEDEEDKKKPEEWVVREISGGRVEEETGEMEFEVEWEASLDGYQSTYETKASL